MSEKFRFFSHKECEYFPCHNVADQEKFNCIFCYCPLFALGDKCGGDFVYLENGVKDCSSCMVPHQPDAYDYIMSRWGDLSELAKKK